MKKARITPCLLAALLCAALPVSTVSCGDGGTQTPVETDGGGGGGIEDDKTVEFQGVTYPADYHDGKLIPIFTVTESNYDNNAFKNGISGFSAEFDGAFYTPFTIENVGAENSGFTARVFKPSGWYIDYNNADETKWYLNHAKTYLSEEILNFKNSLQDRPETLRYFQSLGLTTNTDNYDFTSAETIVESIEDATDGLFIEFCSYWTEQWDEEYVKYDEFSSLYYVLGYEVLQKADPIYRSFSISSFYYRWGGRFNSESLTEMNELLDYYATKLGNGVTADDLKKVVNFSLNSYALTTFDVLSVGASESNLWKDNAINNLLMDGTYFKDYTSTQSLDMSM